MSWTIGWCSYVHKQTNKYFLQQTFCIELRILPLNRFFLRKILSARCAYFLLKEAPYSWFSLKHFLYRSESSRDSRVESSRSGEIFKNYI